MSDDLSQTPTRRSPYNSTTDDKTPLRSGSVTSAHMLPSSLPYDDGEDDMEDFQPIGHYPSSQGLGVSSMGQGHGRGGPGMQHTLGRPFEEDEDDEQTPIVPEMTAPPASLLPAVPGAQMRNQESVLQSPFRNTHPATAHYPPQHSAASEQSYVPATHVPAVSDPRYASQPQTSYPQYFVDPYTGMPTPYVPMTAPAATASGSSSAQPSTVLVATTYAPVQYAAVNPANGQIGPVPTGDALLARPKVKLTHQDKRNIVQLHRTNSSLRQEDIARQYGYVRSLASPAIE